MAERNLNFDNIIERKGTNAVCAYIKANIEFTEEYIAKYMPKVVFRKPEGTYLVWLDFRGYGLSDSEINDLIINTAGLWFDNGEMFGESGQGFQRINAACPRTVLSEALNRLRNAFDTIEILYEDIGVPQRFRLLEKVIQ